METACLAFCALQVQPALAGSPGEEREQSSDEALRAARRVPVGGADQAPGTPFSPAPPGGAGGERRALVSESTKSAPSFLLTFRAPHAQVAAVGRCAVSCTALNDVVSLDSTWRGICLSMPAMAAFAPHAASGELDAPGFRGGWRGLGKKLKGASKLLGSLELPDSTLDPRGDNLQMRTTPQGQCVVSYVGPIGGDRAVRTQEPWLIWYRKMPKPPPASGFKEFRNHLRAGGFLGQPGTSCHKEIAAYLQCQAELSQAGTKALQDAAEYERGLGRMPPLAPTPGDMLGNLANDRSALDDQRGATAGAEGDKRVLAEDEPSSSKGATSPSRLLHLESKWRENKDPRAKPDRLWERMTDAEKQYYIELADVRRLEYEEEMRAWTRTSWSDGRLLQPVLRTTSSVCKPTPWLHPDALADVAQKTGRRPAPRAKISPDGCDGAASGSGVEARKGLKAACFAGFREALARGKDAAPASDAAAGSSAMAQQADSVEEEGGGADGARDGGKLLVDMLPIRYFEITILRSVEEMDRMCSPTGPSCPDDDHKPAGDAAGPATGALPQPSPSLSHPWGQEWCLSVGLCLETFRLTGKQPGWDASSVAVHSDDGRVYFGELLRVSPRGCSRPKVVVCLLVCVVVAPGRHTVAERSACSIIICI